MLEESTTYQATLELGEVRALWEVLLMQGRRRFGVPPQATEAALRSIEDRDRLKRMAERLLDVTSWQELLETP